MICPNCNAPDQSGNYCAQCGVALTASCPSCGSPAEPGALHCTQCGEAFGADRQRSRAGWIMGAVAATVVVLVFLATRQVQHPGAAPATNAAVAGAVGAGGLSTNMRENADRLFNRVMSAAEAGNQAEVDQFLSMAIEAYGMVDTLDADGLFHVAVLRLTAHEYDEAVAAAERMRQDNPGNILALGVEADAAIATGDSARARTLYRALLDAYPEQSSRPLPEYVDHQRMLEVYRDDARAFPGEN